jgi:hypothetical protein
MKLQTLQPAEMVQLMQGRPMQAAIVAINLLLVVWIAWMLASLTLDLIDGQEPVVEAVPVEVMPASSPCAVLSPRRIRRLPVPSLPIRAARRKCTLSAIRCPVMQN